MKRLFVFCLLTSRVFSQDITSDLVICMPLDGSAIDVSGNNNNGVMTSVLAATDRFGNINSAVQFSGNPSKIVVPSSSSISNIETLSELTITSWCKITSFSPTNCFPVANKRNASTNWGWDYTIQPPSTHNGQILVPNYPGMGSSYAICKGNEGVTLNQWDFYAITFSRENSTFKVYKNAVLLNTVNTSTFTLEATGTGSLYIGCSPASTYDYANGFMDDFKMYSRALTSSEILAVYNSTVCSVSGVNEHENENLCVLFPNPCLDKINVFVKSNDEISQEIMLTLYSYDGKLIKKQGYIKQESGNYLLDVSDIANGFYVLNFTSGEHSQNFKLNKE